MDSILRYRLHRLCNFGMEVFKMNVYKKAFAVSIIPFFIALAIYSSLCWWFGASYGIAVIGAFLEAALLFYFGINNEDLLDELED